jgi:hypothetical protein
VNERKKTETGEQNDQPLEEFNRGNCAQRPQLAGVRVVRVCEAVQAVPQARYFNQ